MELKNSVHESKQLAEKIGMYRKIIPLKPLFFRIKKVSYI